MKLKKWVGYALSCAVLMTAGVACAQYTGPSHSKMPANVEAILKKPVDDQYVVLRGNLLRKIGKERYEFSDGTGSITVEIDHDLFHGVQINEKTRVELYGKVDKDFGKAVEVEVKSMKILAP